MRRNLDMTALRSFVAVAEVGSVTRAAGLLHFTQSAVSMQLKRLEEALDVALFDRRNRQMVPTGAGEQLLSYARRMVALNDEAVSRLTDPDHEGEVTLGVPHDIIQPVIPGVLRRFSAAYPRMRINLASANTAILRAQFARGDLPLILTTEDDRDAGGETLADLPLVWIGARSGRAWTERPLRLAFPATCMFRAPVQQALDRAGIAWTMAVDTESSSTVEASLSADLSVQAIMEGTCPPGLEVIDHGGALPDLPMKQINLYFGPTGQAGPVAALADMLREGYRRLGCRDHDLAGRPAAA